MKECDIYGGAKHTLTLLHIFREGPRPPLPQDIRPWLRHHFMDCTAVTDSDTRKIPRSRTWNVGPLTLSGRVRPNSRNTFKSGAAGWSGVRGQNGESSCIVRPASDRWQHRISFLARNPIDRMPLADAIHAGDIGN